MKGTEQAGATGLVVGEEMKPVQAISLAGEDHLREAARGVRLTASFCILMCAHMLSGRQGYTADTAERFDGMSISTLSKLDHRAGWTGIAAAILLSHGQYA